MNKSGLYSLLRGMGKGILMSVAVCSLLLITSTTTWASVNKIADAAGILNQSQVRRAGASLQYPVDIYTTRNFSGTKSDFLQRARNHLAGSNLIVMAISVNPNYMTVVASNNVPLSNSEADNVISSFRQGYQSNSGNFTSATVSALQTLQSAVSTSPAGGSRGTNPAPASGGGLNGLWCLVGLVVLGLLAFFVIRGRRSGGLPFNRPQYDQPYQGNYPPNYGPGYPPQQQQGGGVNPFAAGGLGAAAGGLLGYELGKERGEREARDDQGYYGGEQGFSGDPGQYGGGSVGDFGGDNNGGDYGGGSVGDYNGGDSGDYGGGSAGSF